MPQRLTGWVRWLNIELVTMWLISAESAKVEDFAAFARILVKMPLPDAIWSNGIGTSVVGTGGFLLTS